MQQRNFIIFFALSLLIMTGWSLLEARLRPRPPRPATAGPRLPLRPLQADAGIWGDLTAAALSTTIPGAGTVAPLATEVVLAEWSARARRAGVPAVDRKVEVERPPPKEPLPDTAKAEEIHLGDETYNLRAILTSRGAGVHSLILNHFQAANSMGLPENSPLLLIPDDPTRPDPSNVLFHYRSADDDRPLDTLGKLLWNVKKKPNAAEERQEAVFEAEVPGQDVRIRKVFSLARGDYHLGLAVEIEHARRGPEPVRFRYQLTSGHGLPIEGVWYTSIYRNALIGLVDNRGNAWPNLQDANSIAIQSGGNRVEVNKGDKYILYAGIAIQYFASLIVVDDQQEKKDFLAWARPTVEGEPDKLKPNLDDIVMRVVSEPVDLRPDQRVVHKYLLYNGPVKVNLLRELGGSGRSVSAELVNRYANTLHLRTLTDYGNFSVWTDLIILCTNFMHWVLGWLHVLIPNYGLCIIALTILVRAGMFPISRKQAQTTMRMQALGPEMKKLQEKYKDDRQALGMAQMELYRKHGVNPFGSCWIMVLQLPVFMGLYFALQESIHLRLAPFLWIKNLAAPDMLIYWGEKIPWLSRPEDQGGLLYLGPYFNILPIIAVALMIVQQKAMTPPPADEQQEMQQKMMKYMTVMFGVIFYKVAAGLCLYFTVTSLWGLAERKLIPKAKPPGSMAAPVATPKASPGRGKPRTAKEGGNGILQRLRAWVDEVLKEAKKK